MGQAEKSRSESLQEGVAAEVNDILAMARGITLA